MECTGEIESGAGQSPWDHPTIRFPGQYYDAETGLHYNRFRYYDPGVGRYISADPIGQWGGVNMYSYVGNRPTEFYDPLGLIPPGWCSNGQCGNGEDGPGLKELDCIAGKLGAFFGSPFVGFAGPFGAMGKSGALVGGGVMMTGTGVTMMGGGAVMIAGGSALGGTGAVAGGATMVGGASVTATGLGVTAIGAKKFGAAFDDAVAIFSAECECDPAKEDCCE